MFKTLYKANNVSGIVQSRTPTSETDQATLLSNGWKFTPPVDPGTAPPLAPTELSTLLGTIVFYRLSADDVRGINQRRNLVHYAGGVLVREGDVFPMIITKVSKEDADGRPVAVNGTVLLDGTDTFWAVDVAEGDTVRTYGTTPTYAKESEDGGYPRAMHKADGTVTTAHNKVDEDKALADGYTRDVPAPAPDGPYPLEMHKGSGAIGAPADRRTVKTKAEEDAATADGFVRDVAAPAASAPATPAVDSGYPVKMCKGTGEKTEYWTVDSRAEEDAAMAEGFTREKKKAK